MLVSSGLNSKLNVPNSQILDYVGEKYRIIVSKSSILISIRFDSHLNSFRFSSQHISIFISTHFDESQQVIQFDGKWSFFSLVLMLLVEEVVLSFQVHQHMP